MHAISYHLKRAGQNAHYFFDRQFSPTVKKTQYVYAICQKDFKGHYIYPLNRLKDLKGFQDIYARHVKKYEGREATMNTFIEPLNCRWNDVVFLAPIHPNLIYQELKSIGYDVPEMSFFKIPVSALKQKRVAYWSFPKNAKLGDVLTKDQFKQITCGSYKELTTLPKNTISYFNQAYDPKDPSKLPLKFMYIPHILSKDPIKISSRKISVINWRNHPTTTASKLEIKNRLGLIINSIIHPFVKLRIYYHVNTRGV
ncbi:MAG: hypothetical protein JHC93_05630 [Parachlamydiales bacterium]|nr:hypothetical protein [Parachlamydiales bacterium]